MVQPSWPAGVERQGSTSQRWSKGVGKGLQLPLVRDNATASASGVGCRGRGGGGGDGNDGGDADDRSIGVRGPRHAGGQKKRLED